MFKKLKRLLLNPNYYLWKFITNFNQEFYYKRYSEYAKNCGLERIYLILSFDCDTQEDINVLKILNNKLIKMNIKPIYAIPGELLLANKAIVRDVRDTGAEFINHGYKIHTEFDKKNSFYSPNFFYDKLDKDIIENDIKNGDKAIKKVLKLKPKGFRTPHFGTYQSKLHLKYLYELLRELDYKFSSSTGPDKSFFKGPIYRISDITEIPVSGCGYKPFNILDSWSFACPYPKKTSQDYLNEAIKVKSLISQRGLGILNYYSDPSHIIYDKNFWKAVKIWKKIATSINYNDLLEIIS